MALRVAIAASTALVLGAIGAPAAVATPQISGSDADVWTVTNPVPTYLLTASPTALGGQVSWALDGDGPSAGPSPLTVKLPGIGDGLHTLTASDLDPGALTPAQRTFRVDLTPPRITVGRPSSGAQIDQNAPVTADYACDGAVTCVGTVAQGAAIDTATVGSAAFSVTATDDVGNQAISIVPYTVRAADNPAPGGAGTAPSEPIKLVQDPAGGTVTTTQRRQPYRPRTINAKALRPTRGLLIPTRRPLLRWTAQKGATLYNLQVFWLHGTTVTKVVSVFPRGHNLRVPAGRVAYGHTYIWRVWPYVRGKYTSRPLGLSYFSVRRQPR